MRLDEVDGESPEQVCADEDAEECAFAVGSFRQGMEGEGECGEEEDFIKLRGVAGDSVAEVDGPGERGGGAVGVVGEARGEAADAADGDADAERDGIEIAGAGVDAEEELGDFDGEPSAEQTADDGLAAGGGEERSPVPAEAGSLLEEAEDACADECAEGGGGDEEPAVLVVEEVAAAGALAFVEGVSGGVGERLEDGMQAGVGSEGDAGAPGSGIV